MDTKWRRVRWGAMRGALVGVSLAALLLALFAINVWQGETTTTAGMGVGILSWLASAPAGLVLLFAAVPALEALGLHESIARNMAVILTLGVCGNWTILGAIYGAVRGSHDKTAAPAT
jgi:hypothetical protein